MPNLGIVIGSIIVNVKYKRGILIFVSVCLLLIGWLIYLIYRPTNLYMFKVFEVTDSFRILTHLRNFDYLPQRQYVPEWIIYNLPDGLWLLSYMMLMDVIWENGDKVKRFLFVFFMPVIIMVWEIMQGFQVVEGTWDIGDMFSYLIAMTIYYCLTKILKNHEKSY